MKQGLTGEKSTPKSTTQQHHPKTATPNTPNRFQPFPTVSIHFCLTLGIVLQSTFFDGTRTRTTA
jgi:hypothetical protein